MRKILLFFIFIFTLIDLKISAQLADGSTAPNWTLTDLNGNSHTLYNILNQGKPVVLDFSATWCGPCWSYHNSGVLEELWDDYGPGGTNQIMVFFIEADYGTNEACLYGPTGCVGGTQGNWVAGTGYPIINLTSTNGPTVNNDYEINYFPTLYAVHPNKTIYEVGQASVAGWESMLFGSFNMALSGSTVDATCPNEGMVDLTITAGAPPFSYEWSNGAHTADLIGVNAGDYDVTVTDANGFEKFGSFTVDGPAVPLNVDDNSSTNILCFGDNNGSASVNPAGGFPGYDVEWSNGENGNYISDLEPGTYSVVVTDNMGCTVTEAFTIEEPEQLVATLTINNAACGSNNGSVYFDSEGGEGNHYYQISNGLPATTNPFFNNLAAGAYTYNVTDDNGCIIEGAFQITSPGAPNSNSSSNGNLTCANTQVTVSGVPANNVTYLWTTTDGNIVSGANTVDAIVDAPGSYTLKVTDNSTGCWSTSSVSVTQDILAPTLAVTNGQLTCASPSTEICATSTYPVSWVINGQTLNQACVAVNAAGTYTATALNNANGCSVSANSTVTASNDLPQVAATAPSGITCLIPEVTLQGTVNGNASDYTITWTTTNGNIVSGANTLTPVVNKGGDYSMNALNNNTQCQASTLVNVTENINTPVSQFSSNVGGGNLTLTNTSNVQNGSATWDLGGGNIMTGESITVTFPTSGVYNICLTVTNECGNNTSCGDVQYYTALAVAGTVKDATCNGAANGEITTTVTGGPITGNITYAWSGPNGFTSSEANISNVPAGVYTCIISDEVGLTATSTFNINEPTAITAATAVTNTTNGENNGAITLTLAGGTGDYTVLWNTGATGNTISNLAAGEYTAVITDANGCIKNVGPIVVSGSVSANDPVFVSAFKVYPNPAINNVNIDFSSHENLDGAQITLLNQLGTKILSKDFTGKVFNDRLDVTSLPAGVYFIELNTAKGNAIRKFIITE